MNQHLRKALSSIGKIESGILAALGEAKVGNDVVVRLNGLYEDNRDLVDEMMEGTDNGLDQEIAIRDRDDVRFLDILGEEGVIDCLFDYVESRAIVKLKNRSKFLEIREWVEVIKPNLVEYGILAFDTARGDVYFLDKKARLTPEKGMYRVFKRLMSDELHTISASEIETIQKETGKKDYRGEGGSDRTTAEVATQVITDLKDALGWHGRMDHLIEHRAGQNYCLLPYPPGK